MSDDIKYKVERARNLSRELVVREWHDSLSKSDSELCADALAGFGDAIRQGKAFTDLDDVARGIVASHADEQAHDFRTRTFDIGPFDCEFTAKALEWQARELAAKLEAALVDA